MIRPRKKSRCKRDSNPGPSALEADALTARPTRRWVVGMTCRGKGGFDPHVSRCWGRCLRHCGQGYYFFNSMCVYESIYNSMLVFEATYMNSSVAQIHRKKVVCLFFIQHFMQCKYGHKFNSINNFNIPKTVSKRSFIFTPSHAKINLEFFSGNGSCSVSALSAWNA